MKSQRNKKSVITVHEDKPIEEIKQLKKLISNNILYDILIE